MPLTPEDVSNKRFTPVRLREGYDMGEVDQFLDEVEAELERLLKESDDLRTKLAAATGDGHGVVTATTAPVVEAAEKPTEKPAEQPVEELGEAPADEAAETPTGSVAAAAPRETIKVVTAAEASSAALRLLELATRNADEVVAEAKEEAEQIVGTARTEAEVVEQEARTRAQNLDAETETKRSALLGEMEQEKVRLDAEVDTLRAFEREYRSRLKSYFTEQLQALDATSTGDELPAAGDAPEPKRLRSVLDAGDAADDQADPATESEGDTPDA
jgi:DivIVA domain-containing protein